MRHLECHQHTNMLGTFHGAASFGQDIHAWDVSRVTDFTNMFAGSRLANEASTSPVLACAIHKQWHAKSA
eukprot:scaffold36925_cov27-Tisochrysis_lutea.AAC.1